MRHFLKFIVVIYCGILFSCQQNNNQKNSEVIKPLLERAEIPYLKGESKKAFDAKPSPDFDKNKWFTNDHCLIEDKQGTLHWFGINNPYPPEGKGLYRYHPYLGHLKTTEPTEEWERLPMAINEIDGTEYLGAPYVVWHEESQRYAMVVEVWPKDRELEIYW